MILLCVHRGYVHVTSDAQGGQSCGINLSTWSGVTGGCKPGNVGAGDGTPLKVQYMPVCSPNFSTLLQIIFSSHCYPFSLEAFCSVSLPPILLTACWVQLSMLVLGGSVRNPSKSSLHSKNRTF